MSFWFSIAITYIRLWSSSSPELSELDDSEFDSSTVARTACTDRRFTSLGRSGGTGAFWRNLLDPKSTLPRRAFVLCLALNTSSNSYTSANRNIVSWFCQFWVIHSFNIVLDMFFLDLGRPVFNLDLRPEPNHVQSVQVVHG